VGVIARVLAPRADKLVGLDYDAVAVHAATINLPGATFVCGDGWAALPAGPAFDWIISNPPLHIGKDEDLTALVDLITHAGSRLTDEGRLVVVAQRTVGVGALMAECFDRPRMLRHTSTFEVWISR
jgi:16S rRNA (guanine1207-N2)-methyltransferase